MLDDAQRPTEQLTAAPAPKSGSGISSRPHIVQSSPRFVTSRLKTNTRCTTTAISDTILVTILTFQILQISQKPFQLQALQNSPDDVNVPVEERISLTIRSDRPDLAKAQSQRYVEDVRIWTSLKVGDVVEGGLCM